MNRSNGDIKEGFVDCQGRVLGAWVKNRPPVFSGRLTYNDTMTATDRHSEQAAALEADQTNPEGVFARTKDASARLVRAQLEREVHANIVNIASRQLGLNRVRILQSKIVARSPELQDDIDDAEERGLITDTQGSHLERTDVILAARRKSDRQAVHVAVEISGLIGERDVNRARARADTLATIKGTPVIPVVVGGSIAPPQHELADRQGVSVVITLRLAG